MRLMTHAVAAIATLAALIGAGADASATTVLQVDVAAMTGTSEWVVNARVLAVDDVDLRAQGGGLATDITLSIDEVYKGDATTPRRYVLRLPGGHGRDGLAMVIPGMPRFTVGERVVLFLEKTSRGHIPCGLGQGVWRVRSDPHGRAWVEQSAQTLHMVKRGPGGRLVNERAPQLSGAKSLAELVQEIDEAQRRATSH